MLLRVQGENKVKVATTAIFANHIPTISRRWQVKRAR